MNLTINTDGGGQPGNDVGGPVAAAYVVFMDGIYLGSQSRRLTGTNNEGEYSGVLLAVEALRDGVFAEKKDVESVKFVSDSQLIVYQLTGKYRCKNDRLRELRDTIKEIIRGFDFPVSFEWKRRQHNKVADQLCTATMVYGDKNDFFEPIPDRPSEEEVRRSRYELNNPGERRVSVGFDIDY